MEPTVERERFAIVVSKRQGDALRRAAGRADMAFAAWAREVLLAGAGASALRDDMISAKAAAAATVRKAKRGRKARS